MGRASRAGSSARAARWLARALVAGAGGARSAIAASLAAAGVAELMLYDTRPGVADALAQRLREHYPRLVVRTGSNDPSGWELIVNATPMGMKPGDPLPFDVERIAPDTFVGEVVMKSEYTPLLQAARAVQGLAMAAILVCARASVRDLYSAHHGLQIMARGLGGLGVVALVAPLLGAWLVKMWGVARTMPLAACCSLAGALIQVAGWLIWPGSAVALLAGHAACVLGHGVHQPCGQAGAIQDLPEQAGRAVSRSGFLMMLCAFGVGQVAALFAPTDMRYRPRPMVLPLVLAGVVLMGLAFVALPRVLAASAPAPTRSLAKPA